MNLYSLVRPLLFGMDAEAAHNLAVKMVGWGLVPSQEAVAHPQLETEVGGLTFRNPVGLAAGFDKNAEAMAGLLYQGFGFVEAGTITRKAQEGNPKPRLFRLVEDEAIINRMGFNNDGVRAFHRNIKQQIHLIDRQRRLGARVGVNIGKNKNSTQEAEDYKALLKEVYDVADYVTLNISSPNTPGLRNLQMKEMLEPFLNEVLATRDGLPRKVPLWLKLAPDIAAEEREAIAEVLRNHPVDALVLTNTTISRPDSLLSANRNEEGGLSGKPLAEKSRETLAHFHTLLAGRVPLVSVGGIDSADEAYNRIKAGASLVQLYSAFIYQGFGLVKTLNEGILSRLRKEGYASLRHAVGAGVAA